MKTAFTLSAPAKINCYLEVLSKREDGFHNLNSLMHMVGLYDRLTFKMAPVEIHLKISDHSLPTDHSNLVYKAARLLQKKMLELNLPPKGVTITLKKEIPIAAGLAGGSSDAAATLLGLNHLWALGFERHKLAKLGESLGSDIPFFFGSAAAWISGRGEVVDSLSNSYDGWIVLVHPQIPVSTASVFKSYSQDTGLTKQRTALNIAPKGRRPSFQEVLAHPINDLESVTLKRFPELNRIKNTLAELGGKGVLMSGSGPTVFAHFEQKEKAEETVQRIRLKITTFPFKIWAVPLLQKSPFENILS